MERYIQTEIHTAGRSFIRQVAPLSTRCVLRFNAVSQATLTVKDTDALVEIAQTDGVRAVVWMITRNKGTISQRRLVEGPLGDMEGSGPFGTVQIPVIDDFAWLWAVLGWQKPTAALNAQTDEYARYTGPSDTRALAAIQANVTRLGLPWNVAASAGLGTVGATELRMHPLADKILPPLTADRLQLFLERDPDTDTWDVGVRTGATYAQPLTPKSGVLAGWKWKRQRPARTRMVIGGAGDGTAREFDQVTDTALETALGRILEGFDDSRMAEAGTDLTPYGLAALADEAAKASITATLRERSWFQFPTAYDIGTRVPLQVGPGDPVEDVISEIEINHSTEGGFTAVPKVGFSTDTPQARLVNAVSQIAASVRTLERK